MCVREVEGEQCSTVQCSAGRPWPWSWPWARAQSQSQVDLGRGAGAKGVGNPGQRDGNGRWVLGAGWLDVQ